MSVLDPPLAGPTAPSTQAKPSAPYRLTWRTKVAYGSGSVASGVANQGLSAFVLLFFNQVMGLPAEWVGFAIMIALVADAFWDPLIGQWSDRTRSRLGRRHPFMYASALPVAIGFYVLWNPPTGLPDEALFAYLLVALMGVRFLISCYDLPSAALAPELAPNYDDRAGLFAYRFFFGISGGLAMVVFTYQFLLPAGGRIGDPYISPDGFGRYGLIGAVVVFVSILVATAGTHHCIKHLHRPEASTAKLGQIVREVLETLLNRSLIVLTISGVISGMAAGLSSGLSAYMGLYYWALPPAHVSYLIVAGALSSLLAVAAGPPLARKFDKKPAVMFLMWASLILGTAPMVGRLLHLMPPNGSTDLLIILLVVSFLAGAMGTMAAIIISSMVADVVEDSQAKTGRRSEGLLFSADSILQKSVTGAGVFASGLLLAAVKFPDNASPATLDPAVLDSLALVYVPLTTALYAGAIACIHYFPINRAKHEENLERIAQAAALATDPIPVTSNGDRTAAP